jgi:inosine/xanthosine triphosphatase
VRDAFAEWSRGGETNVGTVDPIEHLPEQPLGDEVSRGAIVRARTAVEPSDADRGVGIEAGLIQLPGSDRWLSVQVCAIVDREGRISLGLGPGYELPETLRGATLAGAPLREALRSSLSIDDAENRGAIYYLSHERVDRYEITLIAVRMALISRAAREESLHCPSELQCRTTVP